MKTNRRRFIAKSLIASAAISTTPFSKVLGANDDIRVAVVGFRGQGRSHIRGYRQAQGARVVALCDVDRTVLDRGVQDCQKHGEKVDAYTDIRNLLEDDSIDVVSTATPNHWHALVTVWACQAGKHVCVEKPVSHNLWEGRKMVEASRKYNRLVQADLDRRSDEGLMEAIEYLHQGHLGNILYIRAFDYKRRTSIGKVNGPQPVPSTIDYDLWTGPAPLTPLMRKRLHYDWHWVWPTGNGEIGNNGPHQLDICRIALKKNSLPERVFSFGGRVGYIDDGTVPNTLVSLLDYDPAPILYECRGLPHQKGDSLMDGFVGKTATGKSIRIKHEKSSPNDNWVIVCQHGYVHDTTFYDNDGKIIKQFPHRNGQPQVNFIKAIRSGKRENLKSDILEGHLSTSLCHLGNISYRVGQQAQPEEIHEAVHTNVRLSDAYERMMHHLSLNEVQFQMTPLTLGAGLQFDADREQFHGRLAEEANTFLSRNYRTPFVIPEAV